MSGQRRVDPLSALECLALDTWAAYFGRTWKRELRHAWETGSYPRVRLGSASIEDLTGILQFLRNSVRFGPAGLIRYVAGKGSKSVLTATSQQQAAKAGR